MLSVFGIIFPNIYARNTEKSSSNLLQKGQTIIQQPTYDSVLSFQSSQKKKIDSLASALAELDKIIKNGPEEKDVNKYKEAEALEYKKRIKENRYWMTNFTRSFNNGTNSEDILVASDNVKAVTAKDIQDVAKKYLTKDKTIGILMPE